VKRVHKIIFAFLFLIFALCSISIIAAQDFDSISHPPDVRVKKGDNISLTWTVTINSVTDPTYDVYINGIKEIDGFDWTLEGNQGSFTIYVNTSVAGVFNYTIVVMDGAGHEISDDVIVTIESRTQFGAWLSDGGWIYIVTGAGLVIFMTLMVFVRQKGFKKSESII
jgi:hypothetical protein